MIPVILFLRRLDVLSLKVLLSGRATAAVKTYTKIRKILV
jgi:hypothetical protein